MTASPELTDALAVAWHDSLSFSEACAEMPVERFYRIYKPLQNGKRRAMLVWTLQGKSFDAAGHLTKVAFSPLAWAI